jgi:hypothetical protein
MTGLLTLSGAPSANLHAATKLYVDGFGPTIAAFNALAARVTALEAGGTGGTGPGPSAWTVTHTWPGTNLTFNSTTGRIALNATNWAGWQPAFDADLNDDLYNNALWPTQASLPVQLYATYPGQSELQITFDNFGGTGGPDTITNWGYHSPSHSIYIVGNNGTGSAIQLRLVKA